MRSSGRAIRKNCSTIWEVSRRVVSSHGIAARGMDKQQLDWRQYSDPGDFVIATDASEKQIANAQSHKIVDYRVAPAVYKRHRIRDA